MYQLSRSLIFSITLSFFSIAHAAIPIEERNALIALYHATDGDNWKDSTGWLGEKGSECEWTGVYCTSERVEKLQLYVNDLAGNIPKELGQLSHLTRLELYGNELTGNIPKELEQLSQLTHVNLSRNKLRGTIPKELARLSQLRELYLIDNQLTGNIPKELGQLSQLTHLQIYDNQLTGNIPKELGQLSQLVDLDFDRNQLTGNIPTELGQLSQLTDLWLSGNQLTGNIPKELGQLSQLTNLWLDGNQLTGEIPQELGQLDSLLFLSLSNNQLTGSVLQEVGQSLNYLYLDGNQLTGNIPKGLGQMLQSLRREYGDDSGVYTGTLRLNNNKLSGSLPREIAINFNSMDVSNNFLTLDSLDSLFVMDKDYSEEAIFFPQKNYAFNLPTLTNRDLFITIPELSFLDKYYKVVLKPYKMESDPEGFYWQLISATEISAKENVPVLVQENLDIIFKNLVVGDDILSTSLEFYSPAMETELLIWKWNGAYSIP